jgi:hypothetical protein
MQSITIIGPNLPRGANPTGGSFVAHREGCRDAARLMKHPSLRGEYEWIVKAATYEDVAEEIYHCHIEEESTTLDEAVNDIHFCPCCALRKRGA